MVASYLSCYGNHISRYVFLSGNLRFLNRETFEIGICIQTFIAGPSWFIPGFSADNRTFSAFYGTYKTSSLVVVNLSKDTIRSTNKNRETNAGALYGCCDVWAQF